MTNPPLLSADRVTVDFASKPRPLRAVDEVSFSVGRHEALGVIGESGSGKSTLARAIMGLVPLSNGSLRFEDTDISDAAPGRRPHLAIVFQDPQSSLNPRLKIGEAVTEAMIIRGIQAAERRRTAAALLEDVGLDPALTNRFPHELSGGQRQRVAIARALCAEPRLLLLDEPTSALDVSVQAQILALLKDLRESRQLSYILITHDVMVVSNTCDRVAVMYRGQIVELGPTAKVLHQPRHPYTQRLLAATPSVDRLLDLEGYARTPPPVAGNTPTSGCGYASHCPQRRAGCERAQMLQRTNDETTDWQVRCHLVS